MLHKGLVKSHLEYASVRMAFLGLYKKGSINFKEKYKKRASKLLSIFTLKCLPSSER